MKDTITEIFDKWIEGPVSHYHLADPDIYELDNTKVPKRSPLNPFLQNKTDIRIKFGGFLEQELLTCGGEFTVRSGINLSPNDVSLCATDLSILEIPSDSTSTESDEGLNTETAYAAIRVHFVDHMSSRNKTYDYTEFYDDFECLNWLPKSVRRFLLVIDEGNLMNSDLIDNLRHMARECEATLLSNNEWLHSENFC